MSTSTDLKSVAEVESLAPQILDAQSLDFQTLDAQSLDLQILDSQTRTGEYKHRSEIGGWGRVSRPPDSRLPVSRLPDSRLPVSRPPDSRLPDQDR